MIGKTGEAKQAIIKQLAKVWEKNLNISQVKSQQNFFEAGGDSLTMAKVHRDIKKELDIPVSIMELFQYPTLDSLATHISKKYIK